jgi:hypothetical protein
LITLINHRRESSGEKALLFQPDFKRKDLRFVPIGAKIVAKLVYLKCIKKPLASQASLVPQLK